METSFFFGTAKSLQPTDYQALLEYRHAVFVKRLGWELDGATDSIETDQFDTPDTIYVAARNKNGNICGHARLLPTDQPYLLGDVFPDLMTTGPVPRTPSVWEVSRFAAADPDDQAPNTPQSRQFEMWMSKAILSECIWLGLQNGVERMVTVSPLGIDKLLKRMGVTASKAGPVTRSGGHAIFAQWIEFDQPTLLNLGLLERQARRAA